MRAVTSRTIAHALEVPERRIANILSRYEVRGITRGQRGQARRIPVTTAEHLALTLTLEDTLGIGTAHSLRLADRLLSHGTGHIDGELVFLHVDLPALREQVHRKLASAIEEYVPPRRGRPTSPQGWD